jgi:C-terminal processing protease CtpA/Prc
VFPDAPGRLTLLPVVLLTNGRTASAAEVLAGALQGNQRCAAVVALCPTVYSTR